MKQTLAGGFCIAETASWGLREARVGKPWQRSLVCGEEVDVT